MTTTRFANRVWAFLLAAIMVLTLLCPQALAANETVNPAADKLVIGLLHHAQYPEFTYKYDMLIKKLAEEREANE